MKHTIRLLSVLILLAGCARETKTSPQSPQEGIQAREKQAEHFEVRLREAPIGEVERAYLQFRLFLEGRTNSLSLPPQLATAFSNEFVNSFWDPAAYRSAYLSYMTLAGTLTNSVADQGFLLGRAGITAFKAKQYTTALQMLRQSFERQVSDETVYYYGLWYWYVQKDKTKAREILSRVRPERLGIDARQWQSLFVEGEGITVDGATLLRSTNASQQVAGFRLWLTTYRQTGEPFWAYEVTLPPYAPASTFGYYLVPQNPLFPRMTRSWPLPFSVRPGKPGQNRYALFVEEPLVEDAFLLLYAQPVSFPWRSGYQGIEPLGTRVAYTNAFWVYATAQRGTNETITNVALDTLPVPARYFLAVSQLYRQGTWHYVVVGFFPPDTLQVIIFDPFRKRFSRVEASLREVQDIYYLPSPLSGEWSWIGVGKRLVTLEEKPLP